MIKKAGVFLLSIFLCILYFTCIVINQENSPQILNVENENNMKYKKKDDEGMEIFQGQAIYAVIDALYQISQIERCQSLRILRAIDPSINILSYASDDQKKFIVHVLSVRPDWSISNLLDDGIEYELQELQEEYGWDDIVTLAFNFSDEYYIDDGYSLVLFDLMKDDKFIVIKGSIENTPYYSLGEYTFKEVMSKNINDVTVSEMFQLSEDW